MQKIEHIIDVLKKSEILSHRIEKTLKKNEALSNSLAMVLNKKSSNNDSKTGCNPANKNMLHNQVIALWKTGKSVLDIAEITGLSHGEVEIIISLAKTSRKN
ncbi:MAG: DUF6115 domain-containing protein [Dissulfurimicrobium sp.]